MGQNDTGGMSCKSVWWLAALVAGVLVAALLMWMRDTGFLMALFWGLVVLIAGGFALTWAFCRSVSGMSDAASATPAATASPHPEATAAAPLATSGPITEPAPVARGAGAAAATLSASGEATAKAEPEEAKTPAKSGTGKVATPKAPAKKPAAKKAPAKAAPKAKAAPVSADGKPELLTEARAGGADDLKQIKGVGPKLEGMLHKMGVFHFDQIASWRKKEVEWVDNNLEGFKGRVSRDEWVKQAKVLAEGGQTEFSKKVKKGGVY